jgi:hypothetical protein
MPTSLFAPDVQSVLDHVKQTAGQPSGGFPSPADWRDQWNYFLMVDRFNNSSAAPRHQPFDDPNFFDFQGGKFSGVQQQLPYLKQLGVGAVWLSPVLKNLRFDGGSYHGTAFTTFSGPSPVSPTIRPRPMMSCGRWSMQPMRWASSSFSTSS